MSETYEQMEAARRAEYNKSYQRNDKQTKGYNHNVPCPWCNKRDDFSGTPIEKGLIVACVHCGNVYTIVEIIRKPIVVLKQVHDKGKPPYEPLDREKWERSQKEAHRVAEAQVDIDRLDAAKHQVLGVNADLVPVFRPLPLKYAKQFAALCSMVGREAALKKLPEFQQQHIEEQRAKNG